LAGKQWLQQPEVDAIGKVIQLHLWYQPGVYPRLLKLGTARRKEERVEYRNDLVEEGIGNLLPRSDGGLASEHPLPLASMFTLLRLSTARAGSMHDPANGTQRKLLSEVNE
jgi:hypothetical protein